MRKLFVLFIAGIICPLSLLSQESGRDYIALSEEALLKGDFQGAEAILYEGCEAYRASGKTKTREYFHCALNLVINRTDYFGPIEASSTLEAFRGEYEASGMQDNYVDALFAYARGRMSSYMGKYNEAEASFRQALASMEGIGQTNDIDYANILSALAAAIRDREKADACFDQASNLLRSIGTPTAMTALGVNLVNSGISARAAGEYDSALEKETEAGRLFGLYLSPDHPFYVNLYSTLAGLYQRMGDVDAMIHATQEMDRIHSVGNFGIMQKVLIDLNNFTLMMNSSRFNDMEKAFPDLRSSITKTVGKESSLYGRLLCNMGMAYSLGGDQQRSEECFKEGLLAYERSLGKASLEYISRLANLSSLYLDKDFHKGITMMTDAVRLYEENFDKRPSYEYADLLAKLSYIYALDDKKVQATKMASEAERILVRSTSESYFNYHVVMRQLSLVYEHFKDRQKAGEYVQKAYQSLVASGDQFTPPAAGTLYAAGMYSSDPVQAGRIKDKALGIIEATGVMSIASVGHMLDRISDIVTHNANVDNPVELVEKLNKMMRANLRLNISTLDEKGRQQYWDVLSPIIGLMPEIVYMAYMMEESMDYSGALYDLSLLKKGQVLSSTTELEQLIRISENPDLEKTLEELKAVNSVIKTGVESDIRRAQLQERAVQLEKVLITASADYGDFLRNIDVTWRDISKELGPNDVAVEFIDCGTYQDSKIFVPLLLRKSLPRPVICSPFVYPEAEILKYETGGNEYYNMLYNKDIVSLGMMWEGVLPYLQKGDIIWFSAEGALNSLALEHMAVKEGVLICDLFPTRRLSSTRELIGRGEHAPSTYVLFGGLDYNATAEEKTWYASERGGNAFKAGWGYLGMTMEEVSEIEKLLKVSRFVKKVKVISGSEGVEESFKKFSGNAPEVIHIATHGFYRRDDLKSDAMKRSGLVFAGANTPSPEGVDDGLLTSEEISLMDLRGCEMVVLSACATGVGAYNSDGVYGLQRAFKKAGVKSILMTLWDVSDEYTSLIMQLIYLELCQGKSPREAYENGLDKFREICSQVGLQEDWLWAGFVMLD